MNSTIAAIICTCGVAWLFYLDRDETLRTSKALWLPVIYFWISWSRPVSEWLSMSPPVDTNVQLTGSPLDAAISAVLYSAAIWVVARRGSRVPRLLVANKAMLVYFFYCLVSVAWSYYPGVSFKRWTRIVGDLAMALIIATDPQPVVALKRVISRVGFILLPVSVLLIKYYEYLGHAYSPDGMQMNTGVTTNKNILGVVLLAIVLCTVWNVMTLLRDKVHPHRKRHLLAQGILLAFGVLLLDMAHSSTGIACSILGCCLFLATNLRSIRKRPGRIHALCCTILLVGGIALMFGGEAQVAGALGRESNLSGRTEIWAAVIPAAPNALIGAGFETFWISPYVEKFYRALVGWWHPEGLNEAHNGYIEIYLNLGWIGVILIATILVTGYRKALAAFRLNPSVGGLALAYVVVSAFYSITEAGFRSPNPMWIFLLISIVNATGVTEGLFMEPAPLERVSSRNSSSMPNTRSEVAYDGGSAGVLKQLF
jgi:O-antigen ligase